MRELAPHQLHLWQYPIHGEPAAELLLSAMSLLNGAEEKRAAAFRFAKNRAEYVLSHAMLRLVLSEYAAIEPRTWSFANGPWGKPQIESPIVAPPLWFNLSHTTGFAVCIVGRVAWLGVDVENTQRGASFRDVAEHSFAPAECEQLKNLPPALERETFFRIWTLKEAYIKAIGKGLSMPLDAFAFHLPEAPSGAVTVEIEGGEDPQNWRFFEFQPGPGHRIAVAAHLVESGSPQVQMFDATPLLER